MTSSDLNIDLSDKLAEVALKKLMSFPTLYHFELQRLGVELDRGRLGAPHPGPPGQSRKFWSTSPAQVNSTMQPDMMVSGPSIARDTKPHEGLLIIVKGHSKPI